MVRKIVLASQSPRRKQLLEWADLEFDILVRETGETYPEGMDAEQVPEYIARNKALAVMESPLFERYEVNIPVLAADTIVELDKDIIGKPNSKEHAIEILSRLSGRIHRVITGVIITDGIKSVSFSDTTEVKFHTLSPAQIHYYVDHYEPFDKAGAYAIQEWIGVTGIEWIRGDFYNVMGLPVSRVVKALENF